MVKQWLDNRSFASLTYQFNDSCKKSVLFAKSVVRKSAKPKKCLL